MYCVSIFSTEHITLYRNGKHTHTVQTKTQIFNDIIIKNFFSVSSVQKVYQSLFIFVKCIVNCFTWIKLTYTSEFNSEKKTFPWKQKKKFLVKYLRAFILIPQIDALKWIGTDYVRAWFIWWTVSFQVSCHCRLTPLRSIHSRWQW